MPPANRKDQVLQVDHICDAFEQSWRDGNPHTIENLLADCDASLRTQLLHQLVLLELELRQQSNEAPTQAEFVQRFPDDVTLIDDVFRELQETILRPPFDAVADHDKTIPVHHAVRATHIGNRDRKIGKYSLVQLLGEGGMGVVYKAHDNELDRYVALKMIRAGIATDNDAHHRFRTEARAIAQLNHPNIAQILEIGEWEGGDGPVPYFALEFAEGGSLRARLRGEPQPAKHAAEQVKVLADAMQVAHERGLVHRDLKPANILIGEEDRLLITDFGLVKRLDDDSVRTTPGVVVGTPSYMAPEQAGHGEAIGPAVDIYALGAILYEMLTGRPPFKGATALDTIEQVRTSEAVRPRRLQASCPIDLDTICMKCLEKTPNRRYASVANLSADLQAFLDGRPIQARPIGPFERAWMWIKKKPAIAASVVFAVAAAMAVVGFVVRWVDAVELRSQNEQLKVAKDQLTHSNKNLQNAQTQLSQSLVQETAAKKQAKAAGKLSRRALNNNRLLVAHSNWRDNNAEGARRLLELVPKDLRHFEWYYLHRKFHPELFVGTPFPRRPTMRLAFSPDGRFLACADNIRSIVVYDLKTGKKKPIGTSQVAGGPSQLAFSPDGRWLAARTGTMGVELWDWQKVPIPPAICTQPIGRHAGTKFAFAPDSKLLYLPFPKLGEIAVHDPASGKCVARRKLSLTWSEFSQFSISPNGKLMATIGIRQTAVHLWNTETGAPVRKLESAGVLGAKDMIFSADSKRLYVVCDRNRVGWDVTTGRRIQYYYAPPYRLSLKYGHAVALMPEGIGVADSVLGDNCLRLTGKISCLLPGHAHVLTNMAFSPDGSRLASGSHDFTVRVWNVDQLRGSSNKAPHTTKVLFTHSGKILGVNVRAKNLRGKTFPPGLWDRQTGKPYMEFAKRVSLGSVAVTRDGKYCVTPGRGQRKDGKFQVGIHVWEIASGRLTDTIPVDGVVIRSLTFSADGTKLIAYVQRPTEPGKAQVVTHCMVFAWRTGKLLGTWPMTNARQPDGRWVMQMDQVKNLAKTVTALAPGGLPLCDAPVVFTANGTVMARIATGAGQVGYSVEVWDLSKGEFRFRVLSNKPVAAIAFSADGDRLATTTNGVQIWDVVTGGLPLQLEHHRPQSVSFSPDGTRLAVDDRILEAPRNGQANKRR